MGLFKPAAASIAASIILTNGAFAATITTTAAVEITDTGTTVESISNSNVDAPSIADGSGILSEVDVNGDANISGGAFIAGGQAPLQLIGSGTYEIEETNTSGASQDYAFDFLLSGLAFNLNGDFGGADAGPNPFGGIVDAVGARFSYDVLLDGTSIFSASAEMFGGSDVYQTANVVNATVNNVGFDEVFGGGGSGARFEVDDIFDTLDLGSIADGDTFNVTATYRVEMLANGFENAVGANFVDPATISLGVISATTTTTQPPMSAVPLPAAGWMLLAGVGGIAAMKRRKKV